MSRAGSQQRSLLEMLGRLRPHWRTDTALPSRIDSMLSGDRRLGSRDRRFYRELIYTSLRYLPWVEPLLDNEGAGAVRRVAWLASAGAELQAFRRECSGDLPPCPESAEEKARILGVDAEALTPDWLRRECPQSGRPPLRDILLLRSPLWVRLQKTESAAVFSEFDRRGWKWRRSDLLTQAVELPAGADVAKTDAFASGAVEVQDIGSQLVLEAVGIQPGGSWLDACAGAGGKTLQLALLLGSSGRVTARDPRPSALEQLSLRARRAGLESRITLEGADPPEGYDGVLVDAPCSGSGTLRRSPHLRWVTTSTGVKRAGQLQRRLLQANAQRVRRGGLLTYATCSLCQTENESTTQEFLQNNSKFRAELPDRRILPQDCNGDGFFVASFRRW